MVGPKVVAKIQNFLPFCEKIFEDSNLNLELRKEGNQRKGLGGQETKEGKGEERKKLKKKKKSLHTWTSKGLSSEELHAPSGAPHAFNLGNNLNSDLEKFLQFKVGPSMEIGELQATRRFLNMEGLAH